ncbi:MAG: stage II sporulation protein M [Nitrososphaerota archaeon]
MSASSTPESSLRSYQLLDKQTKLESLFNISYWLWRFNPLSIFPIMLSSAVEVLKESIIVITLIFFLSQLAATNILNEIANALIANDFLTLFSILSSIISIIIFALIIAAVIFFLASIIAGGFLNSAEYGSYFNLLRNGTLSISNVLEEIKVRWARMAWTVFIVEIVKYCPISLALVLIFLDILNLSTMGLERLSHSLFIIDKFLLWLGFILIALIFTLIFTVLTLYTYPAAINGFYGFSSIKKSIMVCKELPIDTLAYCILRALSLILIVIISLIASLLGIQLSSIITLVLSFIIIPIFHIFKTSIFLKAQPNSIIVSYSINASILKDVFSYILKTGLEKIKKGLYELTDFLVKPKNISFHIFSIITFSLGILIGEWISYSGIRQIFYALGYVPGEMNPLFKITYGLPFLALNISFHNWQVSLATALSGIIFIIPVLTTLFFNGFILGVSIDIIQNLTLFMAAILPHGIIELPAFIISGSVGLRLGSAFLKALKQGNLSSNIEFHQILKRTIYIMLGLIPLFIIAGIIETFITPYIMRMYGWK